MTKRRSKGETQLVSHHDKASPITETATICKTVMRKDDAIALHPFSQVPEFLQINPYIIDGYRVHLSYQSCLKSLFVLSNETINIWTHLLGFIIFAYLLVYDNMYIVPWTFQHLMDRIVVSSTSLFYMSTLLLSTLFHLFHCHSEESYCKWLKIDVRGIGIGIIGGFLSGIYGAYYCHQALLLTYSIASVGIIATSAFVLSRAKDEVINVRVGKMKLTVHRIYTYMLVVAFAFIPIGHFIYINGGFAVAFVRRFAFGAGIMLGWGLLGCLFLIFKFPECLFPGKFDYIASSHQFWHFLGLIY
ncbi:uncharacterized protein TRIADDRAFT_61447 [Trichoplax adhaerens]|uniref:Uncharacterized protein n=1 Tax=Trichoplax adhaerens TaxID=10228 RepID=B3SB05_TRIAD|nr:hypothetical protein TRIADDRAFT_61447 [Trichoplax adhaerens]EDV20079.1 hypothetical protein TRIADDRAFT_61447 [Trichoplax adhaerens]|eukprot:XP_002117463.1 hypothetical protein TRIADDRAFT_61447 [Trichoplax adhaerens]